MLEHVAGTFSSMIYPPSCMWDLLSSRFPEPNATVSLVQSVYGHVYASWTPTGPSTHGARNDPTTPLVSALGYRIQSLASGADLWLIRTSASARAIGEVVRT